ncbi:MAG TPA: twin-arginine translocation signal domain-containing protein, partial [Verrucomicrobiales bacterium]|nr:twin-arginine translocation signal domain-containing protein [Verrucomicrobiales bacterium]
MKKLPSYSRRDFLEQAAAAATVPLAGFAASRPADAQAAGDRSGAIEIGSRLELMVDDFLIDSLSGKTQW